MSIPFIDLQAQRRRIATEIDRAVAGAVEGGQYVMGPQVRALEEQLAEFADKRAGFRKYREDFDAGRKVEVETAITNERRQEDANQAALNSVGNWSGYGPGYGYNYGYSPYNNWGVNTPIGAGYNVSGYWPNTYAYGNYASWPNTKPATATTISSNGAMENTV